MFCLRAWVWGDWLYKKGQKNIQTNREEDFFFLFAMAPCHDTHQSRTYRNILHAAIIIISRRFFYFFYFSLLLHRKVREKRGSIKARLLVGPSWWRWARKRESVWLDETRNSPRRIGIGDGRQSRRVASRFEEGKTWTVFFNRFFPAKKRASMRLS